MWFSSSGTEGYEVPFRSIVLHAVSRDTATSPQPCILAQVEGPAPGASAGEDEEDDEPACTQLRLVPADKASCACSQPPRVDATVGCCGRLNVACHPHCSGQHFQRHVRQCRAEPGPH